MGKRTPIKTRQLTGKGKTNVFYDFATYWGDQVTSKHRKPIQLTEECPSESQREKAADDKQRARCYEKHAQAEDLIPVEYLPPGLGLHHDGHTAGKTRSQ